MSHVASLQADVSVVIPAAYMDVFLVVLSLDAAATLSHGC
jgi:hypothetical protein